MPEGFAMGDISGLPSWQQYLISANSLVMAYDPERLNPEETLMVQLTNPELRLVTFGLIALKRIFPEFGRVAEELMLKLSDVAGAQEFFEDFE